MADEVISAPGGGAAPTGGGGGGSSPAAPATPVAQPAAPAAQPAAAPASPATPVSTERPVKGPAEPDNQFLERYHKWNDAQPKPTGDEQPVVADPAKPAPAAAEPAKPAVDPAKPAEPAKPATEPEKPAAAVAAVDPLDSLGPLPASKMAEILTANPELDAALEKSGVKDELFQGLREAAVASQFREEFADIETARFAKGAAITMHQMDLAATELKPGDLASTTKFVQEVLMPLSYILDEEGKPKMREIKRSDGAVLQIPETDGTVQTMLNNFRDLAVEQIVADAQELSKRDNPQHKELGERLLAAVHEIQSFIKGSDDNAAAELPENLKAEKARLDAQQTAINTQKAQEADQRYETFKTGVLEDTNAALDKTITGWLEGSSLAPNNADSQQTKESKEFSRNAVIKEIRDGLFAQFNRDSLFLAEQEQYGRRGYSAATKALLVNHYTRSANAILTTIATPILTKAGHERVRQSAARAAKIDAQGKISKMEPTGATSPALPRTAKVDELSVMAEARQELIKELRRDPPQDVLIQRFREKVAKLAQPA